MASLREIASCIGLGPNFRVLRHFFGYVSTPGQLSVLQQINRLKGRHIHVNIIRVGIEAFTNADEREIDAALQFTRDTYATVNLGIGRVERYFITTADANGRDNINNDDEAETLTDEWTVPNSALDVFIVRTYAGVTIGLSAVDGPCDKDAKGMDGSVIEISNGQSTTSLAVAHEMGHYLGLSHVSNSNNLMFPTDPNGGQLSSGQGSTMRSHCFTRSAC